VDAEVEDERRLLSHLALLAGRLTVDNSVDQRPWVACQTDGALVGVFTAIPTRNSRSGKGEEDGGSEQFHTRRRRTGLD
jgi:hypothetical protein